MDNTSTSPSATTSPRETNSSSVLAKQENSSDADSSTFLDTILLDLDSPIPTFDEFPETITFSPSGSNHAAVPVDDHTYNMEKNFVSSEEYWDIQSFMELVGMDNEDCHTMSPNSLHQPIYSCDPAHDDFWVSPFI